MNSQTRPRIFLDYAATTPLRPEAVDAMRAALADAGFNPSSLHAEGRRARAVLDGVRERVAAALGVARKEIEFTGSGTESDNHALIGVAHALGRKGRIVSTVIEHHAVLHALGRLRDEGYDVVLLDVEPDGTIDPGRFDAALGDDTLLASVMYANNEIGTVQPIADLARLAHARGALFHTDAIQVPGWLPLRPRDLGVDLLSLSGHKFFGPKGVGVLYVRDGVAIAPILHGGGQEYGRRSGTENVLGIAGLARALELAVAEQPERAPRIAALRDRLEAGIRETIPQIRINGAGAPRLPHLSNASFAGTDSQALLVRLDLEGVAVSAGSACTAGALEPSHVIAALGADRQWQTGVIRFSLGPWTTPAEVDAALEILRGVVGEIRAVGGDIGSQGDTRTA